VAAQVRAMLPQFWGISGSTKTMFSIKSLHSYARQTIVFQMPRKINLKMRKNLTFFKFPYKIDISPENM
jgi:hypothetical protein